VRETNTLARLAGDEFVLILEAVSRAREGEAAVRKVLAALRAPFVGVGRTLTITVSAGMTWFDGGKSTSVELLTRADAALYEAQRAGRNTVRLADVEAHH
jgi:diguanylate cyclase (GGDEF)-like protein